jgi:hypothetical protein
LADSVRSVVATRRVLFFLLANPLRVAVLIQEDELPADAEGETRRSAPSTSPASRRSVSGCTRTATRTAPRKVGPLGGR